MPLTICAATRFAQSPHLAFKLANLGAFANAAAGKQPAPDNRAGGHLQGNIGALPRGFHGDHFAAFGTSSMAAEAKTQKPAFQATILLPHNVGREESHEEGRLGET